MVRPCLARRLGVASLLTTVVLSAAACGGDDSAADPASGETSAETSNEDETESSDDTEEASGDLEELSAEEFYPAVMAALQDAETMRFSVTTGTGASAMEVGGSLRYAGDAIEMAAGTTGAQAFDMVMLDKTLYISGDGLPLPDGKTWLKVDLSDPNSLFGQLGKSTDPSTMFRAMEAPKSFELIGTEEVGGVETNHYDVVLDTASYAEAMELPAETTELLPEELAMQMWVDADNRPRKFVQEIEIPDPSGSGEPTTTTTEGTYSDFGADVDIEAPPAADVADNVPGLS